MTTFARRPHLPRLERFLANDPVLARVRDAAGETPVFLVGGAIRDALCGLPVDDIDLVVESDPEPLVRALDPAAVLHDRFGTAELRVDGFPVDIARARTESYPQPGSLPVVTFGTLADDLFRRDFTINSVAVAISPQTDFELIDPFNGLGDLRCGLLRVLHPRSFRDDPTRAIRAARYAARFGFSLASSTLELLHGVDFDTISAERLRAELTLLAREPQALPGFRLLADWGLLAIEEDRFRLAAAADRILSTALWRDAANREVVLLAALLDPLPGAIRGLARPPALPSEGVERVAGFDGPDLVLARAGGAEWLDEWRRDWRLVKLEITGADLLAAGVPEGPAIGAGMRAALAARLDRGVTGRERELGVALAEAASRS